MASLAAIISIIAFVLSGGSSSGPASAPQDAIRLQKPLQHDVAVTVKLIQVYVTDKSGRPVTHLDRSAFRIYDNGVLQAITEFEKHISSDAVSPVKPEPAGEKVPGQPPGTAATVRPAVPAPRMNRKFFILIDFDANDVAGVARSRAAALHFLDTQALPSDEFGVFSYSFMRGVVLHVFLTADQAKVREAIQRIRDVPGRSGGGTGGADTGPKILIGEPKGFPTGSLVPIPSTSPGRVFLDRMSALAKAMRYVPGYKNILYFSQGGQLKGADGEYVRRLGDMSREFAASNAPFFAINTRTPDPFSLELNPGGDWLAFVAESTGGKAFKEVGAVIHFPNIAREIQELTRNYYVLGFPVKETWDGKYHKIKVELTSGDYHLQSQPGYYNPKPFRDYSDLEMDLHLFDLAMSEKTEPPLPIIFSMRALAFEQKGEAHVLMLSKIPTDVIEKFLTKKVEIVSLIFDEQDSAVERRQIKPDLSKFRGMDLFYSADAALGPGTYRCRIIVRDLDTGDAALAYARIVIPVKLGAGGSAGALTLLSPLLLVAGSNFAYLDDQTKKNTAPWMDFYAYDRAKFSPLTGELALGAKAIYALLPFLRAGAAPGEISVSASLIDSASGANRSIPSAILNKSRNGNVELQLAEITVNGIAAGRYALYIRAEEEGTKAVAYAQVPFTIR